MALIFDNIILPILYDSCEVWVFKIGKDVEKVYLRFCIQNGFDN